jgi:cytochrome c551
MRRPILAVFVVLALAAAACGGGDDGASGGGDHPDLSLERNQASVAVGIGVYASYCTACHGPEGYGGVGPNLATATRSSSDAEITETISAGRAGMPAFGDQLSAGQIEGLVDYIRTLPLE